MLMSGKLSEPPNHQLSSKAELSSSDAAFRFKIRLTASDRTPQRHMDGSKFRRQPDGGKAATAEGGIGD